MCLQRSIKYHIIIRNKGQGKMGDEGGFNQKIN